MSDREDGFYWVEFQEFGNADDGPMCNSTEIAKWAHDDWWSAGSELPLPIGLYDSKVIVLSDRLLPPSPGAHKLSPADPAR